MNIYIESYGCSANQNNAEIMAGIIENAGLIVVTKEETADIVIINSCVVKGPTEQKIVKRIKEINKPLILAGCMPETQSKTIKETKDRIVLVGPYHIIDILKAIQSLTDNKPRDFIGKREEVKLSLPRIRKNKIVDIIQVSEGCNGKCAYCIVKIAKGKLFSYPKEDIVKQAKACIENNAKEIWLTSQDTAAYEHDLPDLINQIAGLKGNFRIRVGMMNPDHVDKILPELIESFKNEKVFKFIHIPVQSGNDNVLRKMRRPYCVSDFRRIIEEFRKEIPQITISTDIICGFPGETEEEFQDSVDLIKDIRPDALNTSRFWPRPGTEAQLMPGQLHGKVTKKRSTKLQDIFYKISEEKNKEWIGKKCRVIIDEKGKNNTLVGRNDSYKPVILKKEGQRIGDIVEVEIKDAGVHDLRT